MHSRNAVQLRVVLFAAALCAALAAATSSGAQRAGPLLIAMARERDPILVRSVSTTGRLYVEKASASADRNPSTH